MVFVDIFLAIADMIDDVRFGKRYGFGSVLWLLGCLACVFMIVFGFGKGLAILGAIGIVGTVLCFVLFIRRRILDIKQKHRAKSPES